MTWNSEVEGGSIRGRGGTVCSSISAMDGPGWTAMDSPGRWLLEGTTYSMACH